MEKLDPRFLFGEARMEEQVSALKKVLENSPTVRLGEEERLPPMPLEMPADGEINAVVSREQAIEAYRRGASPFWAVVQMPPQAETETDGAQSETQPDTDDGQSGLEAPQEAEAAEETDAVEE